MLLTGAFVKSTLGDSKEQELWQVQRQMTSVITAAATAAAALEVFFLSLSPAIKERADLQKRRYNQELPDKWM
jgi:hypothetical protein